LIVYATRLIAGTLILKCLSSVQNDIYFIVFQLFLNPLKEVFGALNVPDKLYKACKQDDQKKSTLFSLGYQLAVQEWITQHQCACEESKFDENIPKYVEKIAFKEKSRYLEAMPPATRVVHDLRWCL